jgi:4-hydroxy-tetrahydrodipicolinate reductase
MRIALIGYGKMGREIDTIARERGETIARVFDSHQPVKADRLADIDICLEFSSPDAVLSNIYAAIEAGKDVVVGTTGWHKHLPEVRAKVQTSGLLYSTNFSLGMNIFQRIVGRAAELMQNADGYDPFIQETHHREKADSPSGTAIHLADIVLEKIERKRRIQPQTAAGRIDPEALQVTSTRAGWVTGTHIVGFDSEADSIELRHVAKNRRGFALGALVAARWLHGRKGIYTMDDVEL